MAEECSTYLFTSESVTEGHPDKVCDQISDAVLDAILAKEIELAAAGYVAPSGQPADPAQVRVACETMATTGMVIVTGEIRTQAYVDVPAIVREVLMMSLSKLCRNFKSFLSAAYSAAIPSQRRIPGIQIISAPVISRNFL